MAKEQSKNLPTSDNVKKFNMLYPMIESDLAEIRELSKKKQDEPLNKFKVKTINKKLIQIKEILRNEPTNDYIELLDEDTFPSNSDAVLMMSQYIKALDHYRFRYYVARGAEFGLNSPNKWKTRD